MLSIIIKLQYPNILNKPPYFHNFLISTGSYYSFLHYHSYILEFGLHASCCYSWPLTWLFSLTPRKNRICYFLDISIGIVPPGFCSLFYKSITLNIFLTFDLFPSSLNLSFPWILVLGEKVWGVGEVDVVLKTELRRNTTLYQVKIVSKL